MKLLDFGIAKQQGAPSKARDRTEPTADVLTVPADLTMPGSILGTLHYMAPEQIEGKGTGFRTEIFSFGVILYEVLTGHNPFRAEHHMSMLYNIVHREPEPIETHLPTCPPPVAIAHHIIRSWVESDGALF